MLNINVLVVVVIHFFKLTFFAFENNIKFINQIIARLLTSEFQNLCFLYFDLEQCRLFGIYLIKSTQLHVIYTFYSAQLVHTGNEYLDCFN